MSKESSYHCQSCGLALRWSGIPRARVAVMQNATYFLRSHCTAAWVQSQRSRKSAVCSQGFPSCRACALLKIVVPRLWYKIVMSVISQPEWQHVSCPLTEAEGTVTWSLLRTSKIAESTAQRLYTPAEIPLTLNPLWKHKSLCKDVAWGFIMFDWVCSLNDEALSSLNHRHLGWVLWSWML